MTLDSELTKLEGEIFAEADKLRAAALAEALKIRKSKLVAEVERIEAELEGLLGNKTPAPTPASTKADAKADAPKVDAPAAKTDAKA